MKDQELRDKAGRLLGKIKDVSGKLGSSLFSVGSAWAGGRLGDDT